MTFTKVNDKRMTLKSTSMRWETWKDGESDESQNAKLPSGDPGFRGDLIQKVAWWICTKHWATPSAQLPRMTKLSPNVPTLSLVLHYPIGLGFIVTKLNRWTQVTKNNMVEYISIGEQPILGSGGGSVIEDSAHIQHSWIQSIQPQKVVQVLQVDQKGKLLHLRNMLKYVWHSAQKGWAQKGWTQLKRLRMQQ